MSTNKNPLNNTIFNIYLLSKKKNKINYRVKLKQIKIYSILALSNN